MSENKIQDITSTLHCIIDMMEKCQRGCVLSIDDQRLIFDACSKSKNTNDIIFYAEEAAHDDMDKLYVDAQDLHNECERFKSLYMNSGMGDFVSFGTYELCQEELKPYIQERDNQMSATSKLWREYCKLNNALDSLDMNTSEYERMVKECQDKKAEHDKAKEHTDELWAKFKEQERMIINTSYYDTTFVDMLVAKLDEIARCIIADIDRIRKEGDNE